MFEILGEQITDDEVNTMIKIAGIKSNDKINFKEFVDFFYKIDWMTLVTHPMKQTDSAVGTTLLRMTNGLL